MQLTDTAGRLSFTTPSADGSAPLQTFVFSSREDVAGEVKLAVLGGKRVEHAGVRVELKGVVELAADKTPHEFVALAKELAPPGASQGMAALRFSFSRAELPHDSYVGVNARVRYFLRAVVASKGGFGAGGALVKELDFVVQTVTAPPALPAGDAAAPGAATAPAPAAAAAAAVAATGGAGAAYVASIAPVAPILPEAGAGANAGAGAEAGGAGPSSAAAAEEDSLLGGAGAVGPGGVKLEVGIEDCLHIEFVYDKTALHLTDTVTGRVFFLLVRIKIKLMELALIRREAAGFAGAVTTESETLTRFELMDGAPIRGERVPIRMFLAGLDLAPSLLNVAGCLSVRYYLNLVLVDEEDRRYFKQCEVTLYRNALGGAGGGKAAPTSSSSVAAAAAGR